MWYERFNIIVTSLTKDYLPANWAIYKPTIVEISTYLGTIGFFVIGVLLFFRYFPMIAISEIKGVMKYNKAPGKNKE
jgi:molybdopterin-containing oxidoreductase family membrane subunit